MIQTRVEGVILGGSAYHICGPEHIATLEQTGIPVVSHLGDDMDVPTVGDDARSSFFTMARHLQNVGHRSILMPAFLTPERSAFNRVEGFKLAMKGWGEYHEIDQKDFLREWPSLYKNCQDTPIGVIVKLDPANLPLAEGHDITQIYYKLSKGLFAAGKLPDAIMAINDAAAFGVYNAAFEMKINIPADIALTGADDDYFGQLPMFRLTTIRQNILQSCKAAVEMLVQRIKTGDATVMPDQCFHSEIALRQSCGRLIAASEDPVLYLPVATSN
ncbi:MAG: substrate-binding domain-containing protein [Chthoniobacterales bacterium]